MRHAAPLFTTQQIRALFGDDALRVHWGDSALEVARATLAAADARETPPPPPLCCDVLVVDGDHTYAGAMIDLLHFARLAGRARAPRCDVDVTLPRPPRGCAPIVVDDVLPPGPVYVGRHAAAPREPHASACAT